jgi:hypothetical protein
VRRNVSFEGGARGGPVGYVEREHARAAAGALDRFRGGGGLVGDDVEDRDARAFIRKALRNGRPDLAAAAGD